MNAPVSPAPQLPAIGQRVDGGFVLGHIFVAAEPFALVVPPAEVRLTPEMPWGPVRRVAGADSYFDGLANTRAIAEAGSELAKLVLDKNHDGQTDWYIPSRVEALIVRGNLAAGGDELTKSGVGAFPDEWLWTSTQNEAFGYWAWQQGFGAYGSQSYDHKSRECRAFVLRREPIR